LRLQTEHNHATSSPLKNGFGFYILHLSAGVYTAHGTASNGGRCSKRKSILICSIGLTNSQP
jgi:hypothetical protein